MALLQRIRVAVVETAVPANIVPTVAHAILVANAGDKWPLSVAKTLVSALWGAEIDIQVLAIGICGPAGMARITVFDISSSIRRLVKALVDAINMPVVLQIRARCAVDAFGAAVVLPFARGLIVELEVRSESAGREVVDSLVAAVSLACLIVGTAATPRAASDTDHEHQSPKGNDVRIGSTVSQMCHDLASSFFKPRTMRG
ncbi:MAG: hypothetical protein PHI06_14905 [Desulfobulbaceae bacterium]|nr:hypothetical protein [Desulfobulbaceae bacterium]